jgi:predicted transcriptional regulator
MSDTELLRLSAQIVSAHAAHNAVSADQLGGVIQAVYSALKTVGTEPQPVEAPTPAVPIKKSIFPTYIVCLEDGRKLKMLKRHLQTAYDLTPDQYRAKWNLPSTYPMVAPEYAEHRSSLAKKIGLGRKMNVGIESQKPSEGKRGKRLPKTETATVGAD